MNNNENLWFSLQIFLSIIDDFQLGSFMNKLNLTFTPNMIERWVITYETLRGNFHVHLTAFIAALNSQSRTEQIYISFFFLYADGEQVFF